MSGKESRPRRIRIGTIWWLVLTGLFLSAAILATHESQALVAGLRTETLAAVMDVQSAFEERDMVLAEGAAMRLWRLARLQADTYLAASVGDELSRLAAALTDAAAGWKVAPPEAAEARQVVMQLVNLRQMVLTGDYSQANSILVWLERR